MKHSALNFRKMQPSELMFFLTEKHYPAVQHLIERVNIHVSSAVKVNADIYPALYAVEKEYNKLVVLVQNQIRKNTRILFPFIENILEEKINSADVLSAFEFELNDIHTKHMQMRTFLADLSILSHGFKAESQASEGMKVTLSELHTLEQHLYRQFYLEDILLMPKVARASRRSAKGEKISP